jgi:hypothetical protein
MAAKSAENFISAKSTRNERVNMEMTVTHYEKNRSLSIYGASVGDRNKGFTETGDYTLAEQNGKTLLRFEVRTKYLGFLPQIFERSSRPKPTKNSVRILQRMKHLVEEPPRTS